MLLHGEEREVCLQMDEQIVREVLLRTAVKNAAQNWARSELLPNHR